MTKKDFSILHLLLIAVLFQSVVAQEKKRVYEKYGVAEGLPEEYVGGMLQDDQGFIWLTTQNGLVKYNGYDFKVYKDVKSEIDSSTIQLGNLNKGIIKTKEGKFWMGHFNNGEIFYFDPSTERGHSFKPQFKDSPEIHTVYVEVLFEDAQNNIWFINHLKDSLVLGRVNSKTEISKVYPYEKTFGNTILGFQNLLQSRKDGNIWYIERSGNLKVWTPKSDNFELVVAHGDKIPGTEINDTLMALNTLNSDDILLIGKHGLYVFDPVTRQSIQQYTNNEESNNFLPNADVQFAFADLNGSYWVIHVNNEITVIDSKNNSYNHFVFGQGPLNFQKGYKNIDFIVPGEQNKEGIVFALVSNFFSVNPDPIHFMDYEFSTKSFTYYDSKFNDQNNPNTPTLELGSFRDNSGLSWLFYRPGFYKESPKTRQLALLKNEPKNPSSIPSNTIIRLFEDSKKRLWIGTRSGIARKKPNGSFQQIGISNDAAPLSLNKFYEDSQGNLWAGTFGQGLYRYQETQQKFEKVDFITGIDPKNERIEINAIQEDVDGYLWVSVDNRGVYLLDKSTGEIREKYEFAHKEEHGLFSDWIPILFLDARGVVWLGDFEDNSFGLFKYQKKEKNFKHYASDREDSLSISSNEIRFITEDDLGRMWVGTDGGLNRYDHQKDIFYRNTNFNIPSTNSYAKATNGKLWITTYSGGGLALVGPEINDVEFFGESKGLLHNDILVGSELTRDDFGQLWLPTARGLSVFDTKKKSFKNYTSQDGFQKYPETYMTGLKTHDGNIWLGSREGNGLNRISPKELVKKDSIPPSVVITAMTINDSSYNAPDGKIFKNSVAFTDEIRLNYNQKDLGFEFVALHYLRSEDNLYSWKLENYDKEWTPASKERKVKYTNLSPGTYLLRVKGSNADGIWNEEGASMAITIAAPWWGKWWAYLSYVLLISSLLFAFYRFKLNRKLQKAEALRLKELDAVKTRLYTNITHEFRTPLTVILGMAHQVLDNPKAHLQQGLDMIIRNGRNLLLLINQILDLSKLEGGKLNLHYQQADIVSFLNYIAESFHSLAADKGIKIHNLSEVDELVMDYDEIRFQQIVSNLISNAIKFTPNGGHIYISNKVEENLFILSVKNTGVGISEADLPHIFERFYQADGSHTRKGEGTGIGLALTRELVKLLGGSISVKSKLKKGSEFTIGLPISNVSELKESTKQVVLNNERLNGDFISSNNQASNHLLTAKESISHENNPHKPLVLIADDNEDVRIYIASCLKNVYNIAIAQNGQECEELAYEMTPDLILLDVMMPFKDGFEVCKLLKADERTSHIPIIMLTAKADMDSRLEGLDKGADDYLTKPFHKKELLTRIANLLSLRLQLQKYYRSSLEHHLSAGIKSEQENDLTISNTASPKLKLITDQGDDHKPSILHDINLENAFVIKAKNEIEMHLSEADFNVEKLCRLLALSNSQVHRKLSALTGLSATHFIRYVRLIKAKELMIDSRFKIAAIAIDCGFNDPAYFSRVFKKEFGLTPQKWRNQNSVLKD
ncbi:ATP-binding protein [Maribacter sp. PR1]|uniref:histidine kinase n=1 Tax=Maribacter cobaltidurans TaxID=1178778 RepID=A0ABU7IYN7_9FLAO|nr:MULTISPECIES: ATP-binding protein [Maribacter]MDC6390715.1 ATP-binding protein [Maribacter sp. PR1]MEE1978107.1 ATP-binding protein [Maribacter cobaltidurans]